MRISDWSSDVFSSDLGGQCRHQRLAFAGTHLRDFTTMENNAAYHLHIIVPLSQRAFRRFAHRGESFRQQVVQLRAIRQLFTEHLCLLPQRSEEHTSELQSLMRISYAVLCLKKKSIKT